MINCKKYKIKSLYDNKKKEQPLSAKDSCRLGSVNLYSFVKNKFRKNASFDYNKYYETVYNAILFMDNVIDAEIEYLQRIKADANDKSEEDLWDAVIKIAQKGRRIGVGFTALGDTIASMGLSFKESDDLVKKIMDVKMRAELDATIDLGYLKGSFGLFDLNKEYPDNIPANDFYANMLKYYPDQIDRMKRLITRRNVSTSTVAPSGSLSIIASRQGTTSGIEPLFKALYTRRRKVNATDKCDFVDPHTGERFIEFFVAHSGLIDFCKIKYDKDFNDLSKEEQIAVFNSSPYKDNEAESIHWEDRLRIQGIIQDRTSSAISTTINLHEKVDKSVVYNIYVNAYESGLKGCTIYRDKSRSGILVTESKPDYKMIKHSAPKRPQILPCDIHSIRQKGGDYICAVGLMDNIPYEIFVFESEKCDHSKGFIKKVKSGHYALLDINKNVIIDNMSKVMLPAMEDLTRGYSYGLRHSGQIKFAVEQLQKSQGNLSDFSKVLARTLKKYIENGESSSETCSKCGEKLVFEDGCKTCKNCGESYCG